MAINNNRPGGTAGGLTPTGQEVVKNKDIDGQTASDTSRITLPKGTKSALDALTRKEGTIAYATDLQRAYVDNGSMLVAVGTGTGSGEINYVTNPDAETDTTGWSTYADAAASTPVDGTGGSPNVTITRNTSSPLRGAADFKLTKDAANRQGQGWSTALTVAAPDVSKKLKVQFDFNSSSANYAAGDIVVYVYDVTNAVLITPSVTSLAKATGTWQITWDSTTSTSYRLIFHVATTNALAWDVFIDNVIVGPGVVVQGAAISGPQAWTPTFNGAGTVTNIDMWYSRRGSKMVIWGTYKNGTPTASPLYFSLPSGLTINTAVHQTGKAGFGTLSQTNSTVTGTIIAGNVFANYIASNGTGNISISSSRQDDAGNVEFISENGSTVFDGSETMTVQNVELEIAEWAGSGTVNLGTSGEEYAWNSNTADSSDTTSFAYGPQGTDFGSYTAGRSKRIQWQTPIQITDRMVIEITQDSGLSWQEIDIQSNVTTYLNQNANTYGIRLDSVSSTQMDVTFGIYRSPGTANFAAAGAAWSTLTTGQFKWRVKKTKAGTVTGFGLASSTQSGLISRYEEGTFALDNQLTGTVAYTRIGNQVTLSWASMSHSSASARSTNAGNVPASIRPLTGFRNNAFVTTGSPAYISRIEVASDGTINISHTDYTGIGSNQTSVFGGSVTYNINV